MGRQDFRWDRKWGDKNVQPASNPSSRELAARAGLQRPALRPTLSARAEVRGSGRVQPRAWTEVGVGPLEYWIARNKQTSFCSQPWPPPYGIQDVCVSSLLLCLNIVCGMMDEGDILGGGSWEAWVLSLLSPISSLLDHLVLLCSSINLWRGLQTPLGPQESSGAGFQRLPSSCKAGETSSWSSFFSSGRVCMHQGPKSRQGILLGLLVHSILLDI